MEEEFREEEPIVDNKNNKKLIITCIAILVGLLAIGAIVYFFVIKKDDNGGERKDNEPQITDDTTDDEEEIDEDLKEVDISWYGEYKTADQKYTLKIQDDGKIYINNKEIIQTFENIEINNYLEINGTFDSIDNGIYWLRFVVEKNSKSIVETPDDSWKDASDCGQADYGEYARFCTRCKGFEVVNIKNHYFYIISDEESSRIYTTDWKKIGGIILGWSDDIEYDDSGIYVCEDIDFENSEYKCINKTKYDFNGNKIS